MRMRISIPAMLLAALGLASSAFAADVPRPEYPRPEMERAEWLNLNGDWAFAFDPGRTGAERGLPEGRDGFDRTIRVPFAPESPLSGIGDLDFHPAIWYAKTVTIPASWKGRSIRLNFEACDYRTTVWVNGKPVGEHQGGYTPFALDVTAALADGPNRIVVRAEDDGRSGLQPTGKQSDRFASYGCVYRRTTGIWQTVWMEPVADVHVLRYRVDADAIDGDVPVTVHLNRAPAGGEVKVRVLDAGKTIWEGSRQAATATPFLARIAAPKLWDVRQPNLYDLEIAFLRGGKTLDAVRGSFGLRRFEVRGDRLFLNGRPFFMRTVLDQGFYPDGINTAPDDAALRRDIELSMAMGFDGARLHQRVFERRYLHWADRLGYIVWGEFADWGLDLRRPEGGVTLSREWAEAMERDLNHPALVGWCPLNERWGGSRPGVIADTFRLTKLIDPVRPAIDASGGAHEAVPDVFDSHNYEQDPAKFKAAYDGLLLTPPKVFVNGDPAENTPYRGQPYFVSEYGGIWWNPGQKGTDAWGYGDRPKSDREYLDRYKALTDALLDNPKVAGFCYTQLTDVEQEVNGLHTFARVPKFDPKCFFGVNQRKAAIENPLAGSPRSREGF